MLGEAFCQTEQKESGMRRKLTAIVLAAAIAGLIVSPVEAKKKKPAPVEVTYWMNWFGDCAGSGVLSLTYTANEGACALYFPGLGDSYSFATHEGTPFALDASKPIIVDLRLVEVVSLAADFEVTIEGEIGGENKVIASGTQTVLASMSATTAPLHFELEPDASLNKAKVEGLRVTVAWTNGATYSQIDFDYGATVDINVLK